MTKLDLLSLLVGCLIPWLVNAQPSYRLLDSAGEEVSWERVSRLANEKKLIFFGELHDQQIGHTAQLELLEELNKDYPGRLLLGMEMFEADTQPIVEEYFQGHINQRSFESEARVWDNYERDYKPMVEYAKTHDIMLIATNVPRRYANSVYHQGIGVLDSLSDYAKQFFPPLPLGIDTTLSIYQEMAGMIPGHDSENMVYSQALKDATMAHFIQFHRKGDQIMLHLNGAYHSKNKEGIPSFLDAALTADHQVLFIHSILAEQLPDHDLRSADFTLVITPDKEADSTS